MYSEDIKKYIFGKEKELRHIQEELFYHPEIGLEEVRSAALLTDLLCREGFLVTKGYCDLPTAFKAEYTGSKPGPTVAFISEYDALPEIGHACGHNIIAAMGYGAACGLKQVVDQVGGKVILFGTPDEERTSGKVTLVENHAFDQVDVVIMCHPYPHSEESGKTMGLGALQFEFHGVSAHVALQKEHCRNALDALVMSYLNINNLKQYIPEANIYGIITHGGSRPNVIPDYTAMIYYVRAAEKRKLQEYMERVSQCVRDTAKASGVEVTITEFEKRVENLVTNQKLAGAFQKHYESISPYTLKKPDGYAATSDIGNVSHVVPTIHSWVSIGADDGIVLHNKEFANACITPQSTREMINATIAMALTGLDILTDEKLLAEIKEEFSHI